MNTIDTGGLSFPFKFNGHTKVTSGEVARTFREVNAGSGEGRNVSITLDISEEGRKALRERVQQMPGRVDWREQERIRSILPKLKMDPVYEHKSSMDAMIQNSLDNIKEQKGSYNLDDLINVRMDAYARQYYRTADAHDKGSADSYISDGLDGNNNMQYHQITKEEDLGYVDDAFNIRADSFGTLAGIWQQRWHINHIFHGGEELPVNLPEGYQDRLTGIMKQAGDEVRSRFLQGEYKSEADMAADAKKTGMEYLRQDKEFYNTMSILFSYK